ncbi:hypothetical protein [Oleisolibacter albus]|uniref:hypothetical protein n=1 Tax=Oleisolibacter albus TaxID=2171757 RepID=UPI0012D75D85|nr:hypothetical protein [Oleisolibacter albus]
MQTKTCREFFQSRAGPALIQNKRRWFGDIRSAGQGQRIRVISLDAQHADRFLGLFFPVDRTAALGKDRNPVLVSRAAMSLFPRIRWGGSTVSKRLETLGFRGPILSAFVSFPPGSAMLFLFPVLACHLFQSVCPVDFLDNGASGFVETVTSPALSPNLELHRLKGLNRFTVTGWNLFFLSMTY